MPRLFFSRPKYLMPIWLNSESKIGSLARNA